MGKTRAGKPRKIRGWGIEKKSPDQKHQKTYVFLNKSKECLIIQLETSLECQVLETRLKSIFYIDSILGFYTYEKIVKKHVWFTVNTVNTVSLFIAFYPPVNTLLITTIQYEASNRFVYDGVLVLFIIIRYVYLHT